ncbi:hypothetical protein D3C80_1224780 [compost metagenome]
MAAVSTICPRRSARASRLPSIRPCAWRTASRRARCACSAAFACSVAVSRRFCSAASFAVSTPAPVKAVSRRLSWFASARCAASSVRTLAVFLSCAASSFLTSAVAPARAESRRCCSARAFLTSAVLDPVAPSSVLRVAAAAAYSTASRSTLADASTCARPRVACSTRACCSMTFVLPSWPSSFT